MQKNFKPALNSFKNTFCVFTEVSLDTVAGLPINFKSTAGSCYYYTSDGMYRLSNHWGRLANSKWRLIATQNHTNKYKLGYATWSSFYPDNKYDKLYYLSVNWQDYTVLYEHKNNSLYDGTAVLRTADATMKRIKQARNILNLTNWAKHLHSNDIQTLRHQIVAQLINTDLPLEVIKKNYIYGTK